MVHTLDLCVARHPMERNFRGGGGEETPETIFTKPDKIVDNEFYVNNELLTFEEPY